MKPKKDTKLTEVLIDNHSIQSNKGIVFGQLASGHFFGFCNTFTILTKDMGFQTSLKTNDSLDIVSTISSQATVINVTSDNIYIIVPIFIPISDTQVFFNKCGKKLLPYPLILGLPTKK